MICTNPHVRLWYEFRLRSELLIRAGDSFQALFEDLMSRRYGSDFIAVKPSGRHGDRKCDGLLRSQRQLFQCYAPEKIVTVKAISKIDEDFDGACNHWGNDFDQWVFVHSHRRGLPPDVVAHLLKLSGPRKQRAIQWSESELRERLFGLSDGDLFGLLGPPFDPTQIHEVGFAELDSVLHGITRFSGSHDVEIFPVPESKISDNALGVDSARMIRTGHETEHIVRNFFARCDDPATGDRIGSTLRTRYLALRNAGLEPDAILHDLWMLMGGGKQANMTKEAAVWAMIAYFFNQCDIFEAIRGSIAS